ncbi:MAG: alpha-ketoglutarate-dependent dioxygenase AlkB [Cyanobacteria bacterium P01_E01_bin.42]
MPPESKITDEIASYALAIAGNLFEELRASVRFEDVGKGRQGAVLLKRDETGCIPIVRTTTQYSTPAQQFQPVHDRLARQIQQTASLSVGFNNALIECYGNAYTKMGAHSDQALDLADESFIAIFSCYQYPESANPLRKLVIESKEPRGDRAKIPLAHNSIVVFSIKTNRRFKHKIVLDKSSQNRENQWLGITYRTSKTFVRFADECVYFADNTRLTLANDEEKQEFYNLRRQENKETDFIYPQIAYTISESDIMPPQA